MPPLHPGPTVSLMDPFNCLERWETLLWKCIVRPSLSGSMELDPTDSGVCALMPGNEGEFERLGG
ncbi:rCG24036, isoform CRA_a [Rattus norvegicus]|uniref:RCG24036, isoform CRA_a n=1 Tax=Rattus norvegicus TaxID=10116 RepID=A6JWE6_RAT|nr:rCG24036, isoform CRA_a [Rattus norvegicus]EDL75555.1 rCG24036, isoform CRA_a [Rattus norvegicus]